MSDPVVAHYDERAATYDESAMHRGLAEAVVAFAGDPEGGLVLDVATGTGLVLRSITERYGARRLVGVDLSAGMLAVATASAGDPVFVRADASALPVRSCSVGLLTCVTALHLMPHQDHVLTEWKRVIPQGGRVVIATFAGERRVQHQASFPRFHEPFRTPDLVAATFGSYGFELTRNRDWHAGADHLLISELHRR